MGDTLLQRYFDDPQELAEKDSLYDAGRLGSRELMVWDMDVLPRDEELLRRAASDMPHDEGFAPFVAAVRDRGAHVEVVSDGLGFYVRPNLARLGVADVPVATNENTLRGGGTGLSFPYGHPSCYVCGTCKRERVRLHQAAGRVVVFVGDGTSDRFAAAHADVVFAKDSLARICAAEGWDHEPWDDFEGVRAWVDDAFENGRLPVSSDDLESWRAAYGHPPGPFICGPEVWGPGRLTPGPGPGPVSADRVAGEPVRE